MSKKIIVAFFSTIAISFLVTGCHRASKDVVEDTRTASRYLGHKIRSMAGTHRESKQIETPEDFIAPHDESYIPLNESDLPLEDYGAEMLHAQPMESPGEEGSSIPGIDSFSSPEDANLSEIFKVIYFNTDDHIVRGKAQVDALVNIANYLKNRPETYVFVEGHCDERASAAYNLALGSRRSNYVRELLIRQGVDLNQLFTVSYGKEKPASLGHTVEDWKKNRRVEFKIHKKR